jgi:hypothetical protein
MWHMTPCVGWPLVWCGVAGCAARVVYFVSRLEYLIKKLPVPTKQAIVISIKVKPRNAFLRMLLVCISKGKAVP